MPHPPTPLATVQATEVAVGHPLPELLRRLYLEIGNGGYGPMYGLLGLDGGEPDDSGRSALDTWRYVDLRLRAARRKTPPRGTRLFPCFDYGCNEFLCVDCEQQDGPMWLFYPGDPRRVFTLQATTLPGLMSRWATGEGSDE